MPLPTNIDREPIRVSHASLSKWSSESAYKARCPACPDGLLLVRRDQKTMWLTRDDRCVSCGQRFTYTDETIAGEPLP
jgi:uncharacterized protein (DUF983 family)